jgi:hypothetical protein
VASIDSSERVLLEAPSTMLHRGLKEAFPRPLPGRYEEAWLRKRGQLVLTDRSLLFIESPGCLSSRRPKTIFSASRQGLHAEILKPLIGSSLLEVVVGATRVRFTVSDPSKWESAIIESQN